MKESVIKVLKVKPHEHPEVYMLKNTLEAMQKAVESCAGIMELDDYFVSYERIRKTKGEINAIIVFSLHYRSYYVTSFTKVISYFRYD